MTRWLAVLVAGLTVGVAPAADPADDLLKLVPPDTAVCVVVRDLRGHVGRLAASPFARWLDESKLLDPLAGPAERRKLKDAERFLTDNLEATPRQLLDEVFGDAVVLAYRPGPPGKPADESGVFLVHARDPARMEAVGERLNALQRESGELSAVGERRHNGRLYLVRTKSDGGTEFLHRSGSRFAFSAQEAAIREVIDRMAAAPETVSPVGDSLRRLGLADAAAVVWFNPPALAADLHAQRDAATDPAEKAVLTQTAKVWAACDGLAVYARPDRGLQIGLAASVDPARLPAEVRELLYPAAGGSAWGAVPAEAVFAVGGRLDLAAFRAAVASFLPDGGKSLSDGLADGLGPLVGRSNLTAVLAGVGPEWVAWADAPATGWLPEWTVAIKLSAEARKPVVQGLDFAVGLLRLGYNRDHVDQLDLTDDTRDGRTVKFLSAAGLPPGLRPAYGVKDGYLVLASSPERVHRFAVKEAADPPLVRLNAERLRAFVTSRRDELAAGLAAQNGRPVAELKRELDGMANVLQAVNRVELRHAAVDGLIRLTVDIEPVKPLR